MPGLSTAFLCDAQLMLVASSLLRGHLVEPVHLHGVKLQSIDSVECRRRTWRAIVAVVMAHSLNVVVVIEGIQAVELCSSWLTICLLVMESPFLSPFR
jgi:hypothetical protein